MSNNFLQNNHIYRLLNFMQGFNINTTEGFTDKQKTTFQQFLQYIVDPIGGEVSEPEFSRPSNNDKRLLYKIKIANNEVFHILLQGQTGSFSMFRGLKETSQYSSDLALTTNGSSIGAVSTTQYFVHGLFFASHLSGGVMSRFFTSSKTQECISTAQSYLIFTWAKDIRTNQLYPCMFVEEFLSHVNSVPSLYGHIYNPDDINLVSWITIKLNSDHNLPPCAAYPVLSQATVRFDDYVFPYLFRKETFTEGAFGIRKIQGKRYFLTKYLALEMIEEGENNG